MAAGASHGVGQAERILVLSLTHILADGRILRQIGTLLRAGIKIEAIGAAGEGADGAGFAYHPFVLASWSWPRRMLAALAFLAARFLPGERMALWLASAYPGISALRDAALAQFAGQGATALIAHDWTSLPAAIALHDRFGLPFHYDSHEFAVEEHAHSALWRAIFPALIRRIEAAGIARAASVSCPGPGICDAMNAAYAPARPVEIIHNVPDGTPLAPKPTGAAVEVLYHGLFKPDRGLLELVASVADWPEHFRLLLRGAAPNPAFGRALEAAVTATGGRVRIAPMVPADRVTQTARASDIGVFLPDISSPQNRYAMPNKLYEYLHAGLMVVVPEGTDMGDMVAASGAGLVISDVAALGPALHALDAARIDAFRQAAHALAREANWRAEEPHFREVLGIEPFNAQPIDPLL